MKRIHIRCHILSLDVLKKIMKWHPCVFISGRDWWKHSTRGRSVTGRTCPRSGANHGLCTTKEDTDTRCRESLQETMLTMPLICHIPIGTLLHGNQLKDPLSSGIWYIAYTRDIFSSRAYNIEHLFSILSLKWCG